MWFEEKDADVLSFPKCLLVQLKKHQAQLQPLTMRGFDVVETISTQKEAQGWIKLGVPKFPLVLVFRDDITVKQYTGLEQCTTYLKLRNAAIRKKPTPQANAIAQLFAPPPQVQLEAAAVPTPPPPQDNDIAKTLQIVKRTDSFTLTHFYKLGLKDSNNHPVVDGEDSCVDLVPTYVATPASFFVREEGDEEEEEEEAKELTPPTPQKSAKQEEEVQDDDEDGLIA